MTGEEMQRVITECLRDTKSAPAKSDGIARRLGATSTFEPSDQDPHEGS